MHGRTKVPTTAEQDETKRKERDKKVKEYREVTVKIYQKRSAGECDTEVLALTEEVLRPNPEILTLWNYRREVFQNLLPEISKEEGRKTLSSELDFLEACLKVNPKAYGVWLHREWVMLHIPDPDWKRERNLCDLFLKYDERNFHCWDYRRFVIRHCQLDTTEEFDFTFKKIADNFSNYSAWHYRSKLLPLVHPAGPTDSGRALRDALDREFELVQNAFFTDPADQSAWFYHQWLLGKANHEMKIVGVSTNRGRREVFIVFNQPVLIKQKSELVLSVNGKTVAVDQCYNAFDPPVWPSPLWVCHLSEVIEDTILNISVQFGTIQKEISISQGRNGVIDVAILRKTLFEHTTSPKDVLERELEMCLQLLELEPENKWCLLSTLMLYQGVAPCEKREEIVELFDRLVQVDSCRKGYYLDKRSKFITSVALFQQLSLQPCPRELDLSNKGLTRLYHPEFLVFVNKVDLSENRIESIDVNVMSNVLEMVLDGNLLSAIPKGVGNLKHLTNLSLNNNKISTLNSLNGLQGSSNLEVALKGNPLFVTVTEEEVAKHLKTLNPNLKLVL